MEVKQSMNPGNILHCADMFVVLSSPNKCEMFCFIPFSEQQRKKKYDSPSVLCSTAAAAAQLSLKAAM